MSFFAKFNKPGTTPITPQKYTVKTVKVASEPRPKPKPPHTRKPASAAQEDGKAKRDGGQATPLNSSLHSNAKTLPSSSSRKRKHLEATVAIGNGSSNLLKPPSPESSASRNRRTISSSRSPLSVRLESSDEHSSSDERASKRYKSQSPTAPIHTQGRKLVNPLSFRNNSTSTASEDGYFVHAEQIANVSHKSGGKSTTRGMREISKS